MADKLSGAHPPDPATPDPDILEITFRHPVEFEGKIYHELRCRAPTWGEMKGALRHGGIEASTHLASIIGLVPIPALNKLDARDGAEIDKFFGRFS